MNKLKKILISFFLSIFLLVSQGSNLVYAQSWYSQSFQEFYTKVYDDQNPDEIFGERYTAAQVQWVIWSLFAMILNGILGQDLANCIFGSGSTGFKEFVECAIRIITSNAPSGPHYANLPSKNDYKVGNLISSYIANNKLSGVGYVASKLNKFKKGIIPEAKAQGFGFTAIGGGIQTLWKAIRNVSYFLLVIIMLILAFMIMFRAKTSPQTVITAQSAIPRVIIALILITFSFAIAGFLIDLVYVVIGILAAILQQSTIIVAKPFANINVWADIFSALTEGIRFITITTGAGGWLGIWLLVFSGIFFQVLTRSSIIFIPLIAVSGLITSIVSFILTFVVLFVILRTFWTLVSVFARIILLIIAGPLYILAGTIMPRLGIGSWIRQLVANLAIYPLTGLLIIIAFVFLTMAEVAVFPPATIGDRCFIDISFLNGVMALYTNLNFNRCLFVGNPGWAPPMTFGVGEPAAFAFLGASLAIIAMIPRTSEIIKSLITGTEFAAGTAIGAALGAGAAAAAYPLQLIHSGAMEEPIKKILTERTRPSWERLLPLRTSKRSST